MLSEGRKGHEIQSMTLAKHLGIKTFLHIFNLRQPWEFLTPRIIPSFQNGLQWHNGQPDFNTSPDIIITTGKKAAAVGKYVTERFRKQSAQLKHIQILNPKDNSNNYDLLLIPEHDQKSGSNIVTFVGSIHPFSPQWFKEAKHSSTHQCPSLAIIIGNPPTQYFRQSFKNELQKIRLQYPGRPIIFCGSPRLSKRVIDEIKALLTPIDTFWFNKKDGLNPYKHLLQQSKHLYITADSLNMLNEGASSDIPITLLAKHYIQNPKHHRFIESLAYRWQGFEKNTTKSIVPPRYTLDKILKDARFQKLLNSPFSSSKG